ncbi:CRISPR-associated protein, Cse3 family [Acidimicrobium ferrooxidans DSM 10331]|uniref:CRISPR-associated protein, Cse3 family n=1 Tax=Acidimicrobium ferrooxidans (strain DSM 10331 / JCM 15462 / NBRC 103882 / ICP) TaxID=525909 RepID=C7LYW5_ACIFD|nr:type I-E CRISPR-associated protein Cas6/Cse3/CasE [Acidimicrobium ferrooxidans]ACU53923.1 CRISPR-associated protein, Cse3 family [Acidimicrobium ferrooxidans DSM 10331]
MFLTRLYIDPQKQAALSVLRNPQRMHAIIAQATSASVPQEANSIGRTLWRVDGDDPRVPILYVVSAVQPQFAHFAASVGQVVRGTDYDTKPYGPLLDRLETGQVYAFRLAANAVRSGRSSSGSADTKRHGHVTITQQLGWLLARSEQHGFTIRTGSTGEPDVAVTGGRRMVFRRQGQRVTIALTEFMGHLEVLDRELLRRSLVTGIGHARAYGCGLLTLAAPARPR